MSIVKKCGSFMQDDAGRVVKRPGKTFRMPHLPAKMVEPYSNEEDSAFNILGLIASMSNFFADDAEVDRRNHKREKVFQHQIKKEQLSLATLYYIGSFKKKYKIFKKSAHKKYRTSLAFIAKMQRAYHEYRS